MKIDLPKNGLMKQPHLGRKIAELRHIKNMTQEELVEACNVSVRTLQRIESGEVTPRYSTIKIILAALGEEMDVISTFSTPDKNTHQLIALENWLQIGWISGIIYFVLGFLDAALEYERFENFNEVDSLIFFISTKISYFIFYTLFIIGLIKLSDYFSNYLLKIIGYLLIGLFTSMTFFDIVTLFYPLSDQSIIALGIGESISFGAMGIVFGIGLMRLQDGMGQLARVAGIFEIISGIFFLVVVLFILGYIMLIPATILEIILLFKGFEFVRSERSKI
ncbi:MAG: hypothetical protein Tsb0034_16210 [Ekhidna sp.]